jgi:3',5'-cyclic AMP phosphodiesterase CpdA
MAFSDFKNIGEVQKKYKIKYKEEILINAPEVQPSEHFVKDFGFYKENIDVFSSDASCSQIIISPILREIYKQYYTKYSFRIQKSISYDDILCGTPDYIFSEKSELGKTVLEKPIVIIVEAKRNDFEQGWGQCLAEPVASQKINDDSQRPVYGVVTDGNLWQFGKLEKDCFFKNTENFTVDNLSLLYGALNYVIQMADVIKKA